MSKPFVILALPRSGTRMVSRSLSTHPDIPDITHEFRGTEEEYWAHPYVLSNFLRDWMIDDDIVRVHLWREDYVAAAISLLTMGFNFPPGEQHLPEGYVTEAVSSRIEADQKFGKASRWSVSYESLTNGKEIRILPEWFVGAFCSAIDVPIHDVPVSQPMDRKITVRNELELRETCDVLHPLSIV